MDDTDSKLVEKQDNVYITLFSLSLVRKFSSVLWKLLIVVNSELKNINSVTSVGLFFFLTLNLLHEVSQSGTLTLTVVKSFGSFFKKLRVLSYTNSQFICYKWQMTVHAICAKGWWWNAYKTCWAGISSFPVCRLLFCYIVHESWISSLLSHKNPYSRVGILKTP